MITQLRLFGGVIGVAICRVAQNAYITPRLAQIVSPGMAAAIQSSASQSQTLASDQADAVRQLYGEAFNFQWRILTYISLANIVFALMTFRRHAKSVHDAELGGDADTDKKGSTELEEGVDADDRNKRGSELEDGSNADNKKTHTAEANEGSVDGKAM